MAHGSDARLAIRSRASDCRLTNTYVRSLHRDHSLTTIPTTGHCNLSLSRRPNQSQKLPCTLAHTSNTLRQTSVLVLLMPANSLPSGKHGAAKTRSVPRQGARMSKPLYPWRYRMLVDETRTGVGEEGCIWWLQLSTLKNPGRCSFASLRDRVFQD
jgi:hypothetical protein